ncbi:thiamine pyrophosphate-binding protein [Marinivivus vitaminiproducens]|uniref:thiamine pyrophosphate-binding protein n=1 Tax=Marinivivus vitaminiproducens TaxID=3035935 RepID=UPI00279F4929|nr:thiamine pyrophosphate-binding protein [Geminicoccaceae bacterium SCSIO 64248]
MTTGGELIVEALKLHEAGHVFCVPGESYLAVLDALHDAPEIEVTVCRQEGGAAMMADAYGKLTGRPGVCMVTRGPGATNASAGVHIAYQDSTPLILLIGQVGRDHVEREAFQEIDYRRMYGQMAKWVAQIETADRIPEFMARAFTVATSGRPGPVVLALPEDMLRERVQAAPAARYVPVEPGPSAETVTRLTTMLAEARRPFLILGGEGWDANAVADVTRFAEAWRLPVGTAFRCQDRFANDHPLYAGDVGIGINPKLSQRIRDADLLLVIGARLGEMTTGGYTLIDSPVPAQTLVHVHPDPEEIGRVYHASLPICASPRPFARALASTAPQGAVAWAGAGDQAHADYLAWNRPIAVPGDMQMAAIVAHLVDHLPDDAIITNGAGNYATWVHRFYRFTRYRSQLAPTSGSMGYGVPAAVGAKRAFPERTVVAFAGDGCFLMHGQELATAAQYGLPIIVIVVNNGMYGTIRMHQERNYPGRISATELKNPAFADLARAYGGHGEVVTRTEEFAGAFERAQASGMPALIEIRLDPEIITPRQTLSEIREAALAKG